MVRSFHSRRVGGRAIRNPKDFLEPGFPAEINVLIENGKILSFPKGRRVKKYSDSKDFLEPGFAATIDDFIYTLEDLKWDALRASQ
jgi:hypothetical protein